MTPVDEFIVKPAGNPIAAHDAIAPPVLVGGAKETVSPWVKVFAAAVAKLGNGNTTSIANVTESFPLALDANIVIEELAVSSVGVPEITPVDEFRLNPVGRVPEETDHVPLPPAFEIVNEYD